MGAEYQIGVIDGAGDFANWPDAAKLSELHRLLRDSGAVAEALRLMQTALDSEPGLSSIDWGYVESRYMELAAARERELTPAEAMAIARERTADACASELPAVSASTARACVVAPCVAETVEVALPPGTVPADIRIATRPGKVEGGPFFSRDPAVDLGPNDNLHCGPPPKP
jgi:hypothetical protein